METIQTAEVSALQAEIARLTAEQNVLKERLKAQPKGITLKVSEKGALSVYGLGRFPVTLYRGQWERLLERAESIKAFIEANAQTLVVKQ